MGVVLDVTERKLAFDRLRSSEQRFRLVTEATRDVLWDLDVASGRYWTSPNAATLFGREAAPAYELTVWEASVHPDDRARVQASLQEALRGPGTIWNPATASASPAACKASSSIAPTSCGTVMATPCAWSAR